MEYTIEYSEDKKTLLKFMSYSLGGFVVPDGVTTIGHEAFRHCTELTSITIPNSVFSIGSCAFTDCYRLKQIIMPDSIMNIGYAAFQGCLDLELIKIPKGIQSIEGWVFDGCGNLHSINIPIGVTRINESAFQNCKSLHSINIPIGVTRIDGSAFQNCESLHSMSIPISVTRLGNMIWRGCSNLKTLRLPASILMIGRDILVGCDHLEEIIVPRGQREKFIQFKALEEYKFIIKESDEDDLEHEKRSDFGHCPDCTTGEAILLFYAKQAEDERKTNIAISLYEDADKLGSVEAAYRLGLLLIDTDYYKAYFYMNKAAQVGYADAKEKLVYFQSIR